MLGLLGYSWHPPGEMRGGGNLAFTSIVPVHLHHLQLKLFLP